MSDQTQIVTATLELISDTGQPVGKQDVTPLHQSHSVMLRAVVGQLGDDDTRAGARDQLVRR